MNFDEVTVVIPVKNELLGLRTLIPDLLAHGLAVVVVDDGSTDGTLEFVNGCEVNVIEHPQSLGNGAAIKSGIKTVSTKYVACMDGDGQHEVSQLMKIVEKIVSEDADLVVGSRSRKGQASPFRWVANSIYNILASYVTGRKIKDLTSGLRVFKTDIIKRYLWLLPNTFSYPTTSTMIFCRQSHSLLFEPVEVSQREGSSHISLFKDGFRFLLIIMKVGTLYSPFKVFAPVSLFLATLGVIRYLYTFTIYGTFTNMSALLLVSGIIVFLMGVLSEQINVLVFSKFEDQ